MRAAFPAERARRPQVDVTQAPHQPVFVPTDRHCPLVARQQTRGVCDADHLGHQERRKVRHVLLRIFVVYLSLIVILAGATMVRVKVDPPAGSAGQNADVR
jgi:hypothetical protein